MAPDPRPPPTTAELARLVALLEETGWTERAEGGWRLLTSPSNAADLRLPLELEHLGKSRVSVNSATRGIHSMLETEEPWPHMAEAFAETLTYLGLVRWVEAMAMERIGSWSGTCRVLSSAGWVATEHDDGGKLTSPSGLVRLRHGDLWPSSRRHLVDALRAQAATAREGPAADARLLGELAACLGVLLEMDGPLSVLAGVE